MGKDNNPKISTLGNYQDDKTVSKTIYFLKEYEDLFPLFFTNIKWIEGVLKEMRITLKLDANPIIECSCQPNPHFNENVKKI